MLEVSSSFKDEKDDWDAMFRAVAEINGHVVDVGVEDSIEPNGQSTIVVAAAHEFGANIRRTDGSITTIPRRPWMSTTADNPAVQAGLAEVVDEVLGRVLARKLGTRPALARVGGWYRQQMQRIIRTYPWTPNAESTIKRKGSSQPLIASETFVNSIRWFIRKL